MAADFYPEQTQALPFDSEQRSLVKLVALLAGGIGPAPGLAALYSGVGSPEGVVTAATGSLYTQTDNGQLWNKVSGAGNTGWL